MTHVNQPKAWPVAHACTQPYQSGSVSHDKGETAVNSCHCLGDVALRMRGRMHGQALGWYTYVTCFYVCLLDVGQVRFTPCFMSFFSLRRNDKVTHIYPGDVAGKRLSGCSFSNYFDVIGHSDAQRVTGS